MGLYLSEGLWWTSYNGAALEQLWPGGGWRWRPTAPWPATQRRGLVALWPLPAAVAVETTPSPLAVSPEGFVTWAPEAWTGKGRGAQDGRWWRFSTVTSIAARDATLEVDGEAVLDFADAAGAAATAALLEDLRTAPAADRDHLLATAWRRASDAATVRERLERVVSAAEPLRRVGAGLWLAMFVVAPLILLRLGGVPVLLALAAVLAAGALTNAVLFLRRHRSLWPEERWARVESALIMLVNWPLAARAATVLARRGLTGLDPVVVAAAMDEACPGRRAFLDRVWRDTRFPLSLAELPAEAAEIVRWHLARRREQLEALAGVDLLNATGPVGTASAYCPRCLGAFASGGGDCPDCPGVALRPTPDREGA